MSQIDKAHAMKAQEANESDEKVQFGFWTYIMTDGILFATLFATFAVLRNSTFGGPAGVDIFEPSVVLAETMFLLISSFTCGMALLAMTRHQKKHVAVWLMVTALFGLAFLTLELNEFHKLVAEGFSWQRSAFLSSFFVLVGTHGFHISIGLLWIASMVRKVMKAGLTRANVRRLKMLAIFWHFLDVVWIFIFTIVYMMGVAL